MIDLTQIPTDVLAAEMDRRHTLAIHDKFAAQLPTTVLYKGNPIPLTQQVYLVQPSVHGNGGWCGSTTLGSGPLRDLLCIDPQYQHGIADRDFGDDQYRICIDENPNHALAIFNAEDERWEIV